MLPNIELDTFTSRSAIETYQSCHRQRYYQYLIDGVGYVPTGSNTYLTTGTACHTGIEFLLQNVKKLPSKFSGIDKDKKPLTFAYNSYVKDFIEEAVRLARAKYQELSKDGIYGGKLQRDNPAYQEFVKQEQISLVEALVRAWGFKELPIIVKNYQVLEVEREHCELLAKLPDTDNGKDWDKHNLWLMGKADALLMAKDTRDISVYSLKTIKDFDWRAEKAYKSDLQGLTEIWLAQKYLDKVREGHNSLLEALDTIPVKGKKTIREAIESSKLPTNVTSVRFCFLVKGIQYEDKDEKGEGTGWWRTHNPLIRGYRKFGPSGIEYAHSYKFGKASNKSGYGMLGKGWESFNVWETEGTSIREWVSLIKRKAIQPEEGDILKDWVKVPEEYWRHKASIEEAINEITAQEFDITLGSKEPNNLAIEFPKYRKSCHYPTDCNYTCVCEDGKDIRELVQVGEMVARKPHHIWEASQIQGKITGLGI